MTDKSNMLRVGWANWLAVSDAGVPLERLLEVASGWRDSLGGIAKPWLCWNVNSDWSYVQQCLVESVGWTPIVGFDPRVGAPSKTSRNAVVVDFNKGLDLPAMSPLFPMEFVWLFADRLAFWHSDLLVRPEKMKSLAVRFNGIVDGETIAVQPSLQWRHIFNKYKKRYWELAGCTTASASKQQFERGSGWWRHFENHPNCPAGEKTERDKYFWDHGIGIRYWAKVYGGKVQPIPESFLEEGHCTQISNPKYVRVSPNNENKNLSKDLLANFNLDEVCARLQIDERVLAAGGD